MSRRERRFAILAVLGLAGVGALFVSLSTAEEAEAPPAAVAPTPEGRVRVEIHNMGGVSGMARAATGRLRDAGFDVVDYGNAGTFDADRASAVLDRVGDVELARSVATTLGIDNVLSEPDSNLYVDVSVLLGSEWDRSELQSAPEQGEAGGVWWDPRNWLNR